MNYGGVSLLKKIKRPIRSSPLCRKTGYVVTFILVGEYLGTADSEGYVMEDGTPLNLSEKDKKWGGLAETFHF